MALDPPQKQAIGAQGGADAAPYHNLTRQDAKNYIKEVKRAFADKAGKYAAFRELMIDFKNDMIEVHDVLVRVKELLQGHKQLVDGFNRFLPEKDWIKLEEDEAVSEEILNKMMNCL